MVYRSGLLSCQQGYSVPKGVTPFMFCAYVDESIGGVSLLWIDPMLMCLWIHTGSVCTPSGI